LDRPDRTGRRGAAFIGEILDVVPWSGTRYIEVPEGTEVNFYLGAKLGSYLAPVAGLAILVILGATFSGGIM
jgi:hypothetical protein